MPSVVSFVGVIGSGKDYQANLLVDKGYFRIDFKDELLDMVSDLVGYNVREDYDWFKENAVGIRRPKNRLQEACAIQDSRMAIERGAMTGRQMLQRFGTEVMRKRDPDYWAKAWKRKATQAFMEGLSVACADCRFRNEVETIQQMRLWMETDSIVTHGADVKFIFCDYRSGRYDATSKHESEAMAQGLLRMGLKDMQEILPSHFLEEVYG